MKIKIQHANTNNVFNFKFDYRFNNNNIKAINQLLVLLNINLLSCVMYNIFLKEFFCVYLYYLFMNIYYKF